MMQGRCIICNEGITNPICINCLDKEIKTWLYAIKPELLEKLDSFKKTFEPYDEETPKCIICKNKMTICPHCYCEEIYETLKENNKNIAKKFLEHFNYDIRLPCKF